MDKKEKAGKILDILEKEFPGATTALVFKNPLELLVSTILSAQTTDKLVNRVTETLFKKYTSAAGFASSSLDELEGDLGSVNFFRNKARSVKGAAEKIAAEFGGRVPETLEELTTLPGVGRKTANIVLGNAFGKNALAVDTHVKRVAGRLGLTSSTDPDKIEADLCAIIPPKRWTLTTHLLIHHGRKTCKATKPDCPNCPVRSLCDWYGGEFLRKKK